ncbi:type II toxin-antitoxin system RelE/ParE family toxin [Candidatus Pacearchaeota archaeon]|nr:type II toxin-antitoxin system RelE/ParE family toxin [Candidatus Pacearchaeota archaeon]
MFDIFLGPQPERFLKKAEKELRQRIWKKLDELKQNPFPSDVVRVVGRKEKAFRVRVGAYRIQYYVFQDKNEITVFDINKRERAYD